MPKNKMSDYEISMIEALRFSIEDQDFQSAHAINQELSQRQLSPLAQKKWTKVSQGLGKKASYIARHPIATKATSLTAGVLSFFVCVLLLGFI